LAVSSASLSNFDYEFSSGPSTEQYFTVEGNNLTEDIILSAPSNFEISESSGSGFGSSITLTQSSGSVSSTTIYARLPSGLSASSYSGVISISSTGATTSNISLSGQVTAPETPDLIITEIADPNNAASTRFVEIYNPTTSAIDLSDYYLIRWTNDSSNPSSDRISLSSECGSSLEPNNFCVISKDSNSGTNFISMYGFDPHGKSNNSPADSNGDDNIAIVTITGTYTPDDSSTWTVIDQYGIPGVDGSGQAHEFEDGRAERKANVDSSRTWNASDWNIDKTTMMKGLKTHQMTLILDIGLALHLWITWNGLSSTSWATAGNWASGSIPVSADNIFIRESTNGPQITSSSAIELNNLTVETSATLTVNEDSSLSITGDFENTDGTLTLKTGASMTVDGNSTGDITYTRSIGTTNWYLISSPVTGQDIDAFASASNLATGTQLKQYGTWGL
jgi:hypothetical protein